jgi:bifunctional DNA-binding transcriptional regulator/antitoxin component of YhaV-PrlF toxin-antitoxin module
MAEKNKTMNATKTSTPFILQCNNRGQIIIPKAVRQSLGSIGGEFDIFSAGKDIFLKKVKDSQSGNRAGK